VGLFCERSAAMVVAILGVMKSGAAYLPLDPSYPAERVAFALDDARVAVLLTQERLRDRLPATAAEPLLVDGEEAESEPLPARSAAAPDDLAYVIYTSGSTGRPKGVPVTHRNVARLFRTTEAQYGFDAADVWTLFHSYAFDFSVWEIWGALLYGGRLVIVPH